MIDITNGKGFHEPGFEITLQVKKTVATKIDENDVAPRVAGKGNKALHREAFIDLDNKVSSS